MITKALSGLERHPSILYGAIALLTLATLLLTLLPADHIGDVELFRYDKLGHLAMFGTWTFLLGLIMFISDRKPLPYFSIFIAGTLFGATIEILQELLPGKRHMDLADLIADIAGCLIAIALLRWLTARLPGSPAPQKSSTASGRNGTGQ